MSYKQKLCKLYGQDTITIGDLFKPILLIGIIIIGIIGGYYLISDSYINYDDIGLKITVITALTMFAGQVIFLSGCVLLVLVLGALIWEALTNLWNRKVIKCKKE